MPCHHAVRVQLHIPSNARLFPTHRPGTPLHSRKIHGGWSISFVCLHVVASICILADGVHCF